MINLLRARTFELIVGEFLIWRNRAGVQGEGTSLAFDLGTTNASCGLDSLV